MTITLKLNDAKESVNRLTEKFSELDDKISSKYFSIIFSVLQLRFGIDSKNFDWESDYKGKIFFELDFLNGQMESLLSMTSNQFISGINDNTFNLKEFLNQHADDLFTEITKIAQMYVNLSYLRQNNMMKSRLERDLCKHVSRKLSKISQRVFSMLLVSISNQVSLNFDHF